MPLLHHHLSHVTNPADWQNNQTKMILIRKIRKIQCVVSPPKCNGFYVPFSPRTYHHLNNEQASTLLNPWCGDNLDICPGADSLTWVRENQKWMHEYKNKWSNVKLLVCCGIAIVFYIPTPYTEQRGDPREGRVCAVGDDLCQKLKSLSMGPPNEIRATSNMWFGPQVPRQIEGLEKLYTVFLWKNDPPENTNLMSQHRQSTQFRCVLFPLGAVIIMTVLFVAWFHAESWKHSHRPAVFLFSPPSPLFLEEEDIIMPCRSCHSHETSVVWFIYAFQQSTTRTT